MRANDEWIGSHDDAAIPPRVQVRCTHCGSEFRIAPWQRGRKFCSRQCYWSAPRHAIGVPSRLPDMAIPEPNSGCWLWLGRVNNKGYGVLAYERRDNLAHRGSFEIAAGRRLLDDEYVLHRCDNPLCINPDHLFLGTQKDNMRDCADKRRNKTPSNKGIAHPNAVLTDAQVRLIRTDTRSYSAIADDFKVSKSTIASIKSGKGWVHIR